MGVPLRKNFQFQLLWFGGAVSQLGTQLTTVALPLLLYAVTGSIFWAGVVAGVRTAALVLTQMPAGVWVDRWDRGEVLVRSQTTQAVAVAAMAVNVVTGANSVLVFVVLAAVDSACTAFTGPARTAAVKAVVPPEQLKTAYAQEEARGHVAWLAGPPLGALLFGLGRAVPFLADALSFLVAAVCAWFAKIPPRTGERPRQRMRHDLRDAWRWLWRRRGLRNLVAVFLALNLLGSAGLLPVMALVKERGGANWLVGLVLTGIGVGGVLGAVLAPRVAVAPGRLLVAVLTLFGTCNVAMVLPFGAWWPFVPLMLTAIGTPLLNVSVNSVFTAMVPDELMGRMDAVLTFFTRAVTPAAPVLGAFVAGVAGAGVALALFGALILVTAVVAAFTDLRTTVPR
ncbi:MFS transporter [Lentzea jiangxiensis]|uniref:Predicted arabinose efflux permease, MFS family n=1 Tax=Lentzea jiangxiensis TaxID=641025 RepID=A0A1H0X5X8_9PSEU|nr:MFS transporter [Lentzea jiangxiensis]SDP98343.1 Predicted arabinose efflux permease, MFS family [Lentzea jiangxiensis]